MVQESVSLLSILEPALGISFTLNLAYIGLPRFRYRDAIREFVRKKMEEMEDIPEQHKGTDWYRQIERLGNLSEGSDPAGKKMILLPPELWAFFYSKFYEKPFDRFLSISAAVVCAMLVFLGVALQLNILEFMAPAFSENQMAKWFWFTAVSALLPVIAVIFGNISMSGALDFVSRSTRNLKITFQKDVLSAEIQGLEIPGAREAPEMLK